MSSHKITDSPYKVCTLLFLVKDDQILLATKKRGFGEGYWNGAGGKIDDGESVEQALVRESQEEISVTPTKYQKVAEHDFHMDVDSESPWHMYVHVFMASEWEGEPTESEEMAPQWFNTADIPYAHMWQDDPYWLPQVLAGQKITSAFTFSSDHSLITSQVKIVAKLPHAIPSAPQGTL